MSQRIAVTNTPLAANGTWSDEFYPGLGDSIVGSVFADQEGTIYIEQSADNDNWDVSTSYAITASDGKGFDEPILLPYVRIRYLNGGTDQGVFRVHARVTAAGPR